jgi:hypothetical protein
MEIMLIAAFVAFFAMVLAWMVAPSSPQPAAAPMEEVGALGTAESPV